MRALVIRPGGAPGHFGVGDRLLVLFFLVFLGDDFEFFEQVADLVAPGGEVDVVEFEFGDPQLQGDQVDDRRGAGWVAGVAIGRWAIAAATGIAGGIGGFGGLFAGFEDHPHKVGRFAKTLAPIGHGGGFEDGCGDLAGEDFGGLKGLVGVGGDAAQTLLGLVFDVAMPEADLFDWVLGQLGLALAQE